DWSMQYVVEDCSARDVGLILSADGTSAGLNGAPYWNGIEHHASVLLKGTFNGRAASDYAGDLMGVVGFDSFIAEKLDIVETSVGTGGDFIKLTANNYVRVGGKAMVG